MISLVNMEISEVNKRYKIAKAKFLNEIRNINNQYVLSNFKFKEGDVVRFKNKYYKPTLAVVDKIYFIGRFDLGGHRVECVTKNTIISIDGHVVDENGYDIYIYRDLLTCMFEPNDVFEVTNIKPKGMPLLK